MYGLHCRCTVDNQSPIRKVYIAYNVKKTSNALVTLVKTKQDCLKKLLKTVRTTRRISDL